MKTARMVTAILSVLLLIGVACDRKDSQANKTPSKSGGGGTIGVPVLTMTNPFFKQIVDTITEEAKKNGMDVVAVSGEFDPSRQYGQVKEFLVKKVSAIVLTPCD